VEVCGGLLVSVELLGGLGGRRRRRGKLIALRPGVLFIGSPTWHSSPFVRECWWLKGLTRTSIVRPQPLQVHVVCE
jgi:hypothetical protein